MNPKLTRQVTLALVIVLGVVCLTTAIVSKATHDLGDSSWWEAWASRH